MYTLGGQSAPGRGQREFLVDLNFSNMVNIIRAHVRV